MAPHSFSPDSDPPAEAWAQDPDAWRTTPPCGASPDACASGRAWPQLDAAPVYWMWLERLERERGGPR